MWQVRWPVTDLFYVCLCLFTYVWSLDLFWKLYIVPMLRELTSLSFNIDYDTLILSLIVWGRPSDWGASLHAEPKSALGSHIQTTGEPIITVFHSWFFWHLVHHTTFYILCWQIMIGLVHSWLSDYWAAKLMLWCGDSQRYTRDFRPIRWQKDLQTFHLIRLILGILGGAIELNWIGCIVKDMQEILGQLDSKKIYKLAI